MLVSSKEMIQKAYEGNYAIGAFNVSNLETLKAVIQAAEAKKSPVILATTETIIAYAGLPYIFALLKSAADLASVPVAIHLDHGKSLETVKKCLDIGYTSVMIDGSALALSENILLTKMVVDIAKTKGIPVEGEIGKLGNDNTTFADPLQAKEFVEKTGVDFLAPAVGTSHGVVADERIDLDLLGKIKQVVNIPLVLHGGSGVPDEDIKRAIRFGIAKVNIHTEIRMAFIKGLKEGIAEYPDSDDHREILKFSINEMQKIIEEKIDLFGSADRI